MTQYCRYCAELCVGNGIFCQAKNKELTESYTKRVNYCKDFAFCEFDAYDLDKKYQPRPKKKKERRKQITFDDIFKEV